MRCLKESRIGGGDKVPPNRVQVGSKFVWGIKAPAGNVIPKTRFENCCIDFPLPQHGQALTLGIIVEA